MANHHLKMYISRDRVEKSALLDDVDGLNGPNEVERLDLGPELTRLGSGLQVAQGNF